MWSPYRRKSRDIRLVAYFHRRTLMAVDPRSSDEKRDLDPPSGADDQGRGTFGTCGVRDAAIVATLFGAGLRVSEALDLRPSDLDLKNGTVRVRHGKADRSRTLALDSSAQAYLERWLTSRSLMGLNGRQPLFCTISKGEGLGSRVDSSYVRRLLPRLAAKAGIERRVHPHSLRHSFATALAYEGKPLPVITAQLGHSSTAVTDRYLAKIGPADLVALVRDRPRLAGV
jgi:site-specific recombinase XerD